MTEDITVKIKDRPFYNCPIHCFCGEGHHFYIIKDMNELNKTCYIGWSQERSGFSLKQKIREVINILKGRSYSDEIIIYDIEEDKLQVLKQFFNNVPEEIGETKIFNRKIREKLKGKLVGSHTQPKPAPKPNENPKPQKNKEKLENE